MKIELARPAGFEPTTPGLEDPAAPLLAEFSHF